MRFLCGILLLALAFGTAAGEGAKRITGGFGQTLGAVFNPEHHRLQKAEQLDGWGDVEFYKPEKPYGIFTTYFVRMLPRSHRISAIAARTYFRNRTSSLLEFIAIKDGVTETYKLPVFQKQDADKRKAFYFRDKDGDSIRGIRLLWTEEPGGVYLVEYALFDLNVTRKEAGEWPPEPETPLEKLKTAPEKTLR